MPETGADSRKKTTVKWSSVDPEFNEQVTQDEFKDQWIFSHLKLNYIHLILKSL